MSYEHLLILDLDDTLIDTSDVYWRARTLFVSEMVAEGFPAETVIDTFESIDAEYMGIMGFAPDRYTKSMLETCRVLLHKRGHSPSDETVARIVSYGQLILETNPDPIDGAGELLRWAASRYYMALLTRGEDKLQYRKLEHAGFASFFQMVKVVPRKDAAAFRHVVETAGYDPQKTWVVGDSLLSDVNPANAIGANCILYAYHHSEYHWRQEHVARAVQPCYVAHNLRAVMTILEYPDSIDKIDPMGLPLSSE